MASENSLLSLSFTTATDLSAKQYYATSVDSSGNAVLATAAKSCLGFLQNTPTSGQTASVGFFGKTKAAITDTIAIGAQLQIASGGTLVNYSSGVIVATALEAGATGNVISVLITPNAGLSS